MNRRYMNAIVICQPDPASDQVKGAKFHDIMNAESQILKFLRYAATLEGAKYVNFYWKPENNAEKGRNYAFRREINQ